MTTKEFISRSSFYAILDGAAFLLSSPSVDFCFKVDVIYHNGSKDLFFTNHFDFLHPNIFTCDIVTISRFTAIDFNIQLKYFVGFYNRLSFNQRDSLLRSKKCNNLLRYLNEDSK